MEIFIYTVGPVSAPLDQRDVVEVLLEAHVEMQQIISRAESLADGSATCGARDTAESISDYVEWMMPMHCADEDSSLAPRLKGRHHVVDEALLQMARHHQALEAPLARLRLLCSMLSRDISRLHALRFELGAAASDLRARLTEHQAFEESAIFPALKRLLYIDELESIQLEMHQRRVTLAA